MCQDQSLEKDQAVIKKVFPKVKKETIRSITNKEEYNER